MPKTCGRQCDSWRAVNWKPGSWMELTPSHSTSTMLPSPLMLAILNRYTNQVRQTPFNKTTFQSGKFSKYSTHYVQPPLFSINFQHGSSGLVLLFSANQLHTFSTSPWTTPQFHNNGNRHTSDQTVCPLETRRFQANLHHLVLTRVMEKTAVKRFFYPAFLTPPPSLTFSDQFAFRPTGSPAAAIITLLHTITNMFVSNPYVAVICLDFSKAFDTVRHSTFMEKMAKLQIQDTAYNWMADFFSGHSHCTQYRDETSTFKCITASVVQ